MKEDEIKKIAEDIAKTAMKLDEVLSSPPPLGINVSETTVVLTTLKGTDKLV